MLATVADQVCLKALLIARSLVGWGADDREIIDRLSIWTFVLAIPSPGGAVSGVGYLLAKLL